MVEERIKKSWYQFKTLQEKALTNKNSEERDQNWYARYMTQYSWVTYHGDNFYNHTLQCHGSNEHFSQKHCEIYVLAFSSYDSEGLEP